MTSTLSVAAKAQQSPAVMFKLEKTSSSSDCDAMAQDILIAV